MRLWQASILEEVRSSHVASACSLPHSGLRCLAVAGVEVVVRELCIEANDDKKKLKDSCVLFKEMRLLIFTNFYF